MMKRIIALLLALILTVGLLPTVALAAEGAPTTDSGSVTKEASKDNLKLVKTVTKEGDNYKVTLESWATGTVTSSSTPVPMDIILLLDQSGSMNSDFTSSSSVEYNRLYKRNQKIYEDYRARLYIYNGSGYVKVSVEKETILFSKDKFTYTWSGGSYVSYGERDYPDMTFYYQSTNSSKTTKIAALKSAVRSFIGKVNEEATSKNVEHRVAIVGFASTKSGKKYKNTELLSTQNEVNYANANASNYEDALVSAKTEKKRLSTAIDRLDANGDTYPEYGFDMANKIFAQHPIQAGDNRQRVVIMFTDGYPAPANTDNFNVGMANNAINNAKRCKDNNAKVYTIGIFDGADPSASIENYSQNGWLNEAVAANRYMHFSSSNYPSAMALNNGGTKGEGNFYFAASNADALNDIFDTISEEISTDTTELDDSATIIDNIPGNFAIPEDAKNITLKVAKFQKDGTFATATTAPTTVTAEHKDGTVTVTGFNFSDEWCGLNESDQPHGSKLIIEFTIHHNNYGGTQPTNAGASIKDEAGKEVIKVDDPTVPVTISKPDDVFTQANEKTYDGTGFDIFDEVAKKADDLANGTNNAFVDIEVKITVEGTDYIYTISKGQQSGTWKQTASPKTSPNVKDEDKNGTPEAYEYPVTITFKDAAEDSTASNSTTATAKFTINYAEAKVKANDKNKKATEADPDFDATVTGMVNDEDATQKLTYTISRTDADDNTVGDHQTITPIGDTYQNNYKVTYETGTLTITKDDTTATEFSLTGKFQKTLNSNTADVPTAGKEFELKITGATPNTNTTSLTGKVTDMTPVKVTGTEDQYNITKSFFGANDKLTFNKEGTYTYTVQEVKPAAPVAGMQYDETIYTLTIKVEDDQHGALTVSSANLTKKGESDADVVVVDFTDAVHNSYTIENTFTAAELPLDPTVDPTTGEVTPKIVKELRVTGNGETAVDMTFNVSVKDKDGKEVATGSAEIKKGAKDKATANFTDLGTLVFPEAGDYTYTIKETKGNTNGVTYDEKTYTLKVKVTAANNVLTVTDAGFSYNNGTEEVSGNFLKAPITITNIYTEPTATVTKTTLTEETWDILPNDIKDNLEEYGYPQFPVKENDKLKLIVDKNVDKVKLAYVVAINGKAGSTVTISDPEADNTGEWSSAADGVDNRMVVFAFEDGVWTIQFKVDCTMKIFFIKTFNRNKTTGKFDTAINTVIANGSEIDSDPTTITDKDPGSFDFSDIVWKELKLTGSKSFTGAEFEATLKLTGIQHEDEVEINSLTAEYAHVEAWPLNWNYTLVAKFDENAVDGSTTLFLTSNGEHLLLDFPAAGTYTFELQETNKTSTNVTYDDTVYTVVVEVAADNQDSNKLVVTRIDALYTDEDGNVADKVIYISGETKSDVVTFVNTVDTGKDDYYPIIIPTIINKDTGMLNKTDHFAYVIGYPDGTVHPNGQITRCRSRHHLLPPPA